MEPIFFHCILYCCRKSSTQTQSSEGKGHKWRTPRSRQWGRLFNVITCCSFIEQRLQNSWQQHIFLYFQRIYCKNIEFNNTLQKHQHKYNTWQSQGQTNSTSIVLLLCIQRFTKQLFRSLKHYVWVADNMTVVFDLGGKPNNHITAFVMLILWGKAAQENISESQWSYSFSTSWEVEHTVEKWVEP